MILPDPHLDIVLFLKCGPVRTLTSLSLSLLSYRENWHNAICGRIHFLLQTGQRQLCVAQTHRPTSTDRPFSGSIGGFAWYFAFNRLHKATKQQQHLPTPVRNPSANYTFPTQLYKHSTSQAYYSIYLLFLDSVAPDPLKCTLDGRTTKHTNHWIR